MALKKLELINPTEYEGRTLTATPSYSNIVNKESTAPTALIADGLAPLQRDLQLVIPPPKYTEIGGDEGDGEGDGKGTFPTFQKWYNDYKATADKNYASSVSNAQTIKNQALIDAQNNYDQNKSQYGSNAAALGAMGLTGSGYSDYLNSRAYAQKQGDINAANRTYQTSVDTAAMTRDQAKAEADLKYMEYLDTQDANKKNAYTSLYNTILSNPTAYSETAIDNLAKQSGLGKTEIAQLKAARVQAISSYLNNNDYDKALLDTLFTPGTTEYNTYYDKMLNDAGKITFKDEDENAYDKVIADALLKEEINMIDERMKDLDPNSTEYKNLADTKKTLQENYDSVYSPNFTVSNNITFTRDNFFRESGIGESRVILHDESDNKYIVEYGDAKKVPDEVKAWADKNASEGSVFKSNTKYKYGDETVEYFVVVNGTVYPINKREDRPKMWTEMTSNFTKDTTKD